MRLTRLYLDVPLASGRTVSVAGEQARYLSKVLRLEPGARLVVFNGEGGEFEARAEQVKGARVELSLGSFVEPQRESPLRITLAQGLSRGERMDFVIQKAVELGVVAVVPVVTARSVVRLDAARAERRLAHWRGVAIGACQQSGRTCLPEVLPPRDFTDFLGSAANGENIVLSPDASAAMDAVEAADPRVTVLVGPEGGLTDDELSAAAAAGYLPVRLGPRVLRTETAALAALSALQCLKGDL